MIHPPSGLLLPYLRLRRVGRNQMIHPPSGLLLSYLRLRRRMCGGASPRRTVFLIEQTPGGAKRRRTSGGKAASVRTR